MPALLFYSLSWNPYQVPLSHYCSSFSSAILLTLSSLFPLATTPPVPLLPHTSTEEGTDAWMHSPRCFPSVKHTTAGSKPTALIHRRVQRPGKAPSFVRKNTCRLPTKGGKKYLFVCYDYCAPRREEDPQSCKARKWNKRILPPLQVVQSCALSAVLGAHAVHIDLSRWRRTDRATLGRVVTPSPSRRDQDHTSQAGSASTLQNRVTYHEPFAGRLPLRGERQTAEPVSSTHPKAERKSADTNYTCKHERKQILEHIHRRKRSLTVNSIQKQSDKCKI